MHPIGETGVWEAFIGIAHAGDTYKYAIETRMGEIIYKADPFAFYTQKRPNTASVIWDLEDGYLWGDGDYMAARRNEDSHMLPMNIYEAHLGSWVAGLDFPGAVPAAGRLCKGDGLYPYRAAAGIRVPAGRQLGLSGDGVLFHHLPLRQPVADSRNS